MSKTPNAQTLEISALIKPQLTQEGEIITSPKDLFIQTLPTINAEVTPEMVKAVDQAKATFNAGYVHAAGEIGHAAMAKDSTLEKVVAKTEVNKDKLAVTILRTETRPDPQKPGETVTRHGVVKPNYKAFAGRADVGQMAVVRTSIRSLFEGLAD